MHVSLIIRPQEATDSTPDAAGPTTTSSLDPVLTSSPKSVSSSATELDDSIPLLPPPMPKLEELTSTQSEAAVIPSSSCAVNTHARNLMLKRRQRKEMKDLNDPSNPICVEEHQSKKKEPVMWIQELQLSPSDRDILFNSTAWLTDSIVDAAQKLLKKACPVSGLQSVAWRWRMMSSQASSSRFWTQDRGIGLQFPPLGHPTQLYVSTIASIPVPGLDWRPRLQL